MGTVSSHEVPESEHAAGSGGSGGILALGTTTCPLLFCPWCVMKANHNQKTQVDLRVNYLVRTSELERQPEEHKAAQRMLLNWAAMLCQWELMHSLGQEFKTIHQVPFVGLDETPPMTEEMQAGFNASLPILRSMMLGGGGAGQVPPGAWTPGPDPASESGGGARRGGGRGIEQWKRDAAPFQAMSEQQWAEHIARPENARMELRADLVYHVELWKSNKEGWKRADGSDELLAIFRSESRKGFVETKVESVDPSTARRYEIRWPWPEHGYQVNVFRDTVRGLRVVPSCRQGGEGAWGAGHEHGGGGHRQPREREGEWGQDPWNTGPWNEGVWA